MRDTERESLYQNIDKMPTREILEGINREDQKVAQAVSQSLPQIEKVVEFAATKLIDGGRLFYLGAGTSGRLGVVDASELPPTFGVPDHWVQGFIAGGDMAIRKAVEDAEDDPEGGWRDLQSQKISKQDLVLGIAASGTTPYVVGALERCREEGISTACIVANPHSPLEQAADFPIVLHTGPEFITGSTRMKAGTAQKMTLNMISTALMVKLGRVQGNRMVDMQLNNQKLHQRALEMVQEQTGLSAAEARSLLQKTGSVRQALEDFRLNGK